MLDSNKMHHREQDIKSFAIHQLAFNECADPDLLIQKAHRILTRWMSMDPDSNNPYRREWLRLLEAGDWEALKKFALSWDQFSIACRQSSPFSVCLTEEQKTKLPALVTSLIATDLHPNYYL